MVSIVIVFKTRWRNHEVLATKREPEGQAKRSN